MEKVIKDKVKNSPKKPTEQKVTQIIILGPKRPKGVASPEAYSFDGVMKRTEVQYRQSDGSVRTATYREKLDFFSKKVPLDSIDYLYIEHEEYKQRKVNKSPVLAVGAGVIKTPEGKRIAEKFEQMDRFPGGFPKVDSRYPNKIPDFVERWIKKYAPDTPPAQTTEQPPKADATNNAPPS